LLELALQESLLNDRLQGDWEILDAHEDPRAWLV
jgi:hypothetical protein